MNTDLIRKGVEIKFESLNKAQGRSIELFEIFNPLNSILTRMGLCIL